MEFVKDPSGAFYRANETVGSLDVIVHGKLDIKGLKAPRKPRIYVWGEDEAVPSFAEIMGLAHSRNALPRGTDPEVDAAFDKHNRSVIRNKRLVLTEAKDAFPELRRKLAAKSLLFSRKAGCGCGCSPGFVVGGRIFVSLPGDKQVIVTDIYITRREA